MGQFLRDVKIMVDNQKADIDQIVRATGLKILARIIQRSPVGNPDLWKVNERFRHASNSAKIENIALRKNKANLTKKGTLKKGLKREAAVQITFFSKKKQKRVQFMQRKMITRKGYTGGRFRGNWQVTFNQPAQGETGRVDKSGSETLASGSAVLQSLVVGEGIQYIYFTNNVPYAVRLEFGWSKQAPMGMVRITAREFSQLFSEAARGVKR